MTFNHAELWDRVMTCIKIDEEEVQKIYMQGMEELISTGIDAWDANEIMEKLIFSAFVDKASDFTIITVDNWFRAHWGDEE